MWQRSTLLLERFLASQSGHQFADVNAAMKTKEQTETETKTVYCCSCH